MIKLNKEQLLKLHTQLIEATGGSHGILQWILKHQI